MNVTETIDGVTIEAKALKSKRASPCNMCGFSDWEPGDVKYIVEHWTKMNHEEGYYKQGINEHCFGVPSREHLCPTCAVSRGLDYDKYYRQNQRAPVKTKLQIPLTDRAYAELQQRRAENNNQKRKVQEVLSEVDKKRAKPEDGEHYSHLKQVIQPLLIKAQIPACTLQLHSKTPFFVAWGGTIVMVFKGFPPSLLKAKDVIQNSMPNLKPENVGSKWPKTTLAAVFDNAPELSLQDFVRLKDICQEYGRKIEETIADEEAKRFDVKTISIVEYQCRSLEKLESRHDVSLSQNGYDPMPAMEGTTTTATVDSVVEEWQHEKNYLPKVNHTCSSRMSSYRTTQQRGTTCVAFLQSALSSDHRVLKQIMIDFRIAVDLEFPGRYAWFAETSWHCTLRSIDTRQAASAALRSSLAS